MDRFSNEWRLYQLCKRKNEMNKHANDASLENGRIKVQRRF